jgi:hypothetical protein
MGTQITKGMRLFKRIYDATLEQKAQGRRKALDFGLPKTLGDVAPGGHSFTRVFTVTRVSGYKIVVDSTDTYKIMVKEKEQLEKTCEGLGIVPVFEGDFVSLDSFPRRNIIREEIISSTFQGGVKTVKKRSYFDILHYIAYLPAADPRMPLGGNEALNTQ